MQATARMAASGAERGNAEPAIRTTQSLCHDCYKVVPAELFVRSGDVWMRKSCAEHGSFEGMYWKDANLFDQMQDVVGDYAFCKTFECLQGIECDRCVTKAYNIMIEVTNKCNLDCPVCCSDANNPHSPDPTIEQLLSRLPPVKRGLFGKLKRPNIVLFGGEPTVRKDLPKLIRELCARGYIPRLATNGVRMTDEKYLKELRDAGLKWVILQFDGFDDDTSELLRGERLQAKKLKAIEMMTAHGFKVQLGTMMVKGINTRYAADILRFVGSHEKLFWMSWYPNAAQSRATLDMRNTYMADMYNEAEEATGGKIKPSDFVASMKMLRWAWRILRTPNLRQKMSTTPLVLVFRGPDDYFPITRLFSPRFALRNLDMVFKLAIALPKVLFYQEEYTPPFLKFLVVEKFHSDETIDLEEASNCHMSFMTHWAYPPFDLYNITAKKRGAWVEAGPQTETAPPPAFVPVASLEKAAGAAVH